MSDTPSNPAGQTPPNIDEAAAALAKALAGQTANETPTSGVAGITEMKRIPPKALEAITKVAELERQWFELLKSPSLTPQTLHELQRIKAEALDQQNTLTTQANELATQAAALQQEIDAQRLGFDDPKQAEMKELKQAQEALVTEAERLLKKAAAAQHTLARRQKSTSNNNSDLYPRKVPGLAGIEWPFENRLNEWGEHQNKYPQPSKDEAGEIAKLFVDVLELENKIEQRIEDERSKANTNKDDRGQAAHVLRPLLHYRRKTRGIITRIHQRVEVLHEKFGVSRLAGSPFAQTQDAASPTQTAQAPAAETPPADAVPTTPVTALDTPSQVDNTFSQILPTVSLKRSLVTSTLLAGLGVGANLYFGGKPLVALMDPSLPKISTFLGGCAYAGGMLVVPWFGYAAIKELLGPVRALGWRMFGQPVDLNKPEAGLQVGWGPQLVRKPAKVAAVLASIYIGHVAGRVGNDYFTPAPAPKKLYQIPSDEELLKRMPPTQSAADALRRFASGQNIGTSAAAQPSHAKLMYGPLDDSYKKFPLPKKVEVPAPVPAPTENSKSLTPAVELPAEPTPPVAAQTEKPQEMLAPQQVPFEVTPPWLPGYQEKIRLSDYFFAPWGKYEFDPVWQHVFCENAQRALHAANGWGDKAQTPERAKEWQQLLNMPSQPKAQPPAQPKQKKHALAPDGLTI